MTAATLLADLSRHGIELSVAGDRLHCEAPAGALTPDLKAALIANKNALLDLLRAGGTVKPVPYWRRWLGWLRELSPAWHGRYLEILASLERTGHPAEAEERAYSVLMVEVDAHDAADWKRQCDASPTLAACYAANLDRYQAAAAAIGGAR
jgi:hypothetical protein